GWRTTPKTSERDEEAALYRASGLPYFPRGAPFEHVGELGLVLGLPPALVERALPHVTVFSGLDRVNARDAAPEVLAAIPGMTRDASGGAGRAASAAPQQGGQFVTAEGSPATRVTARISFDDGRRIASEAVILPGDSSEPFRILSWRADIDV